MTERLPNDAYWVTPGSLMAGPYPAAPDELGTREKLHALTAAGATHYVNLTEPGELNWDGIPLREYHPYLEEVVPLAGPGTLHRRMPIVDVSIPTRSEMRAILDHLSEQLGSGDTVYVHCWGGTGSTGTVVGCHLVETGMPADRVVDHIATLRRGLAKAHKPSPQTPEQVQFILDWNS